MSDDPVTPQPDTPPPNEKDQDSADLDPQIEPEPATDDSEDAARAAEPGAVNTLINPRNS